MTESYHVRIHKPGLVFSAAHFITYGGDVCEPLHGHNYHVYAEVHGLLDENQYVVDFIALRDALQRVVSSLDHRMLLPTGHPTIRVEETPGGEAGEVTVVHGRRRWVFPRQDCVLLPVANTTAELLARYIAAELRPTLENVAGVHRIEVGVDECDGQWGVYRWSGQA
ncbi:MAG: 6-pyruvoyl tetrahydrobiopterin synthase [Planctomycetota bacterium]|nr:MAG: 6-pyruvoyl tetrahydrobiopterin synthase [Planctomycetota bacterium]